jgi:hypothetical protein
MRSQTDALAAALAVTAAAAAAVTAAGQVGQGP